MLLEVSIIQDVFDQVAKSHPKIETNYAYIDAFTMWLIRNPEEFDVVVTQICLEILLQT